MSTKERIGDFLEGISATSGQSAATGALRFLLREHYRTLPQILQHDEVGKLGRAMADLDGPLSKKVHLSDKDVARLVLEAQEPSFFPDEDVDAVLSTIASENDKVAATEALRDVAVEHHRALPEREQREELCRLRPLFSELEKALPAQPPPARDGGIGR